MDRCVLPLILGLQNREETLPTYGKFLCPKQHENKFNFAILESQN